MNRLISFLSVIAILILVGCESGSEQKSYKLDNPNMREVKVTEVVQTSSYTYLKMKEEGDEYWGAIPRREDIEVGGTYYFDNFMEMKDFQSTELNKTFKSVYFIQDISAEPFPSAQQAPSGQTGSAKVGNQEIEPMEPTEGSIQLSELFANRAEYNGKVVKVRGHVVKFTEAVMNRNWVHIQDGSQHGNNFDLTITTTDVAELGDIATFEGTIILDKDFGYGYSYEVLMENAVLLNAEKPASLQ